MQLLVVRKARITKILQNCVEVLACIYGLWYSQIKPGGCPHHSETNLNPKDPLNPPGAPTLLNLLQPLHSLRQKRSAVVILSRLPPGSRALKA